MEKPEKPQSLADFLGVLDPQQPELPVQPAPASNLTVQQFCKDVLSTVQYRESLLRRIIMDELPAAIEQMLYHYAHGKPVERLEVKDTTDPLEDFTPEQCEERAMKLLEVARQLRASDIPSEDQRSTQAVH